MPVQNSLHSYKIFNQLKNGVDFTSNTSDFCIDFTALIGEKVRAESQVNLTWYAEASPLDEWQVQTGSISRQSGSFFDDGFLVGQSFQFYPSSGSGSWANRYSATQEFIATIDTIQVAGQYMTFTITGGSQVTTGSETGCGIWIDLDNTPADAPDAIFYKWNALPNGDNFSNNSLTTNEAQTYYAGSLTTSATTMQPQGTLIGWTNGQATCEKESTPYAKNNTTYKIIHDFTLTPFYVIGWLTFLQASTKPPLFAQNTSLAYLFECEFRHGLAQTTGAKTASFTDLIGTTGFFGESFGGIQSDYSAGSVTYTDTTTTNSRTGIQKYAKTTASFTLSKTSASFTSGQKVGVYIAYLPPNESDYQQTTTDLEYNFMLDRIFHTEGTAATTGTGVIKRCEATLNSGDLDISVDIEYTSAQQMRIDSGDNYAIWVIVEDATLTAPNSDRVALIADAKEYDVESLIDGLATWTKFNILIHNEDYGVDTGTSGPLTLWNEAGILVDWELTTDLSNSAQVSSVEFKLVAYNSTSGESFDLDSYTYDLSAQVQVGTVQQINVDTTRGYPLAVNDQFNYVKMSTGTTVVGVSQTYSGAFAQKIKWQEWIQNLDVDTVFYDVNEPQDNLNFLSSNYSMLQGYDIHMEGIITLSGLDQNGQAGVGKQTQRSGVLQVLEYGVSDDGWTGVISRHDPDNFTDLGDIILDNKNTLFRVDWTHSSTDLTDVYVIHRMEPTNNQSDAIEELSSLRPYPANQKLIPKAGETQTTLAVVGSVIRSECWIDYTKLDPNTNYNLSAEIRRSATVSPPNFTVAYVGCNARLTNTYSGGTITNIQYQFYINTTTLVDTQSTLLTDYDWEPASLFHGESIRIVQTVTLSVGSPVVSESTFTFPAFAGCFVEFDTNIAGTGVFDPQVLDGTGESYWRFPSNTVQVGQSQNVDPASDEGFDGTTHTVVYTSTDYSQVSSVDWRDDLVINSPDLSLFTAATTIILEDNTGLTGFTSPAITSTLVLLDAARCGLSGTLDLTPFGANLGGNIFLDNNPLLTAVSNPTSANAISAYRVNDCNLSTIDISALTGIVDFIANDNSALTSVTTGIHSSSWTSFWIYDCNFTGTLDLSGYTGMGGDFRAGNNPLLTGITNAISINPYTVYQADRCNLTGTWDGSTIILGGVFDLGENSALTTVTHGFSIEVIQAYRLDNCNLTGSHSVAFLTALEGTFDVRNNPLLTGLTLSLTSGTFDLFTASGCDLGYVDITNQTFASDADITFRDNNMTAAEVNQILVDLDNTMPATGTGTIDVDGTNAAPDTTSGGFNGSAAVTSLQGKGYTVTTS